MARFGVAPLWGTLCGLEACVVDHSGCTRTPAVCSELATEKGGGGGGGGGETTLPNLVSP